MILKFKHLTTLKLFGFGLILFWVSCFKDYSSDLDNLSEEQKNWLRDVSPKDGFADSIHHYAPGCLEKNSLDSCYKLVRDTFTLPHLSLDSGDYQQAQKLIIDKINEDYLIKYTLDGSDPDDGNSEFYDLPIILRDTVTLKVALFDRDKRIGRVVTITYNITVKDSVKPLSATPSPDGAAFYDSVIVKLTTASESDSTLKIFYTFDGTDPDQKSEEYKDSLIIRTTTTIKFRGYSDFTHPSQIFEVTYNISQLPVLKTPVANKFSGDQPREFDLTFTVPDDSIAEIRYNLTDTDPDTNSTLYTGPIKIVVDKDSIVVKAIAFRDGHLESSIARYVYTLGDSMPIDPGPVDTAKAPQARNVFITGTPKQGNLLTGSYDYFDPNGDLESGTTFQWYRDNSPISNATGKNYTLTSSDTGAVIKFEVTPKSEGASNTLGTPASYSLNTSIAGLNAPAAINLFVSGSARQNETLSLIYTYEDTDGDLESGTTFRWFRDGEVIPGAEEKKYAIQYADSGKVLTFEVTPRSASADSVFNTGTPAVSPGTAPVTGFNAPSVKDLSIWGSTKQGDTLSVVYTFVDPDGDAESGTIIQWFRENDTIPGDTTAKHIVVYADSGKTLSFQIQPGSVDSIKDKGIVYTSPNSNPVTGFNPPSAENLSLTGNRIVGEVLTASYTFVDLDGDAELGTVIRWLRNGTEISGEKGLSYTVKSEDVEKTLTFEVTPRSMGSDNVVGGVQTVETFIGAKLVKISSGGKSFSMGSDSGDADEKPVHTISFAKDFYIDSTEVTQGQYDTLMKSTYSEYTTPDWSTFGNDPDLPAYSINWYDAVMYCNARSKRDGLDTVYTYSSFTGQRGNGSTLSDLEFDFAKSGYRLPTEAEWEYAARGGTTTVYYWGDVFDGAYAWYFLNSSGIEEVAQKLPNAYGLYDMLGNVQEWVNDGYDSTYYSSSPSADPVGPRVDSLRVLRGGSRTGQTDFLRVARRSSGTPDYRLFNIGFRCVRN